MKKNLVLVVLMVLALTTAAYAVNGGWITHVSNWWIENSQLTDPIITYPSGNYQTFSTGGHNLKVMEMGLGYVSASAMTITPPALSLPCIIGVVGAVDGPGSEGSFNLGSNSTVTDSISFVVAIPPTMAITGTASDLYLELEGMKPTSAVVDDTYSYLRVFIYDDDTTAAIVSDTITFDSGVARGWEGLKVNSGGIGAVSSIAANDRLYIRIYPEGVADTVTVYGVRLKYRAGMEVTD